MAVELFLFLAGVRVPETDGLVGAAGGEDLAVRRKGDRDGSAAVAGEGAQFLERGGVPEFDQAIDAGGSEAFAVPRECAAVDSPLMSVDSLFFLAVATFQSRTVPSRLAARTVLPSGVKARAVISVVLVGWARAVSGAVRNRAAVRIGSESKRDMNHLARSK